MKKSFSTTAWSTSTSCEPYYQTYVRLTDSIRYLYNELKVSTTQVYFFNTYFFEALTKNTKGRGAINYDAVKSWTRREDIFDYDHIVVPINEKYVHTLQL
jgi:Ulp1 family protease